MSPIDLVERLTAVFRFLELSGLMGLIQFGLVLYGGLFLVTLVCRLLLGAYRDEPQGIGRMTEEQLGKGYYSPSYESLLEADAMAAKKAYEDEMAIYDDAAAGLDVDFSGGWTLEDLLSAPDGEIPDKFLGGRHDSD